MHLGTALKCFGGIHWARVVEEDLQQASASAVIERLPVVLPCCCCRADVLHSDQCDACVVFTLAVPTPYSVVRLQCQHMFLSLRTFHPPWYPYAQPSLSAKPDATDATHHARLGHSNNMAAVLHGYHSTVNKTHILTHQISRRPCWRVAPGCPIPSGRSICSTMPV